MLYCSHTKRLKNKMENRSDDDDDADDFRSALARCIAALNEW